MLSRHYTKKSLDFIPDAETGNVCINSILCCWNKILRGKHQKGDKWHFAEDLLWWNVGCQVFFGLSTSSLVWSESLIYIFDHYKT